MEEHCSLPRFFPLSLLQISPFYIPPSIQAVNLLSWGSRAVFFSLSILLVFLRKYAVKRADYYMALQAASLSLDLAISLTLSPSFLLYFPLSLSLCLSFNPFPSFNFVCGWGLVKKLFPSPWCAFFAIVSHQKTHYCPSPHVESAISVNEGLTGVERVTERETGREEEDVIHLNKRKSMVSLMLFITWWKKSTLSSL